jgi:hypothetical protein
MYAAIYLKLDKEPGKRIVVCQPFLKSESAAWLCLRSEKRNDKPGLVLEGEAQPLQNVVEYLSKRDSEWKEADKDKLFKKIEKAGKKLGARVIFKQAGEAEATVEDGTKEGSKKLISIEDLEKLGDEGKLKDFLVSPDDEIYLTLAALKMPRKGYFPNFITKEGRPVWNRIIDEYSESIRAPKDDLRKQWAIALIIFRRACAKANVEPFDIPKPDVGNEHEGLRNALADEIRLLARKAGNQASVDIKNFLKTLMKEELITGYTGEEPYDVTKFNGGYRITVWYRLKLADDVTPEKIFSDMATTGWHGDRKGVTRKINKLVSIEFAPDERHVGYAAAYIHCDLTRAQATMVMDIDDDAAERLILTELKKAMPNWVSKGQLKQLYPKEASQPGRIQTMGNVKECVGDVNEELTALAELDVDITDFIVLARTLDQVAAELDERKAEALAEEVDALNVTMLRHVRKDRLKGKLGKLQRQLQNLVNNKGSKQFIKKTQTEIAEISNLLASLE